MKKIVCIIVLLVGFSFANAQEFKSKKGENYLPETGDWAISFNANGVFKYLGNTFNGNLDNQAPSLSSPEGNSFVGKKFITDKSAYRVVVDLGYYSTKQPILDTSDNKIVTFGVTTFNLNLGVGKEWRKGKTRLQGLYGIDGLLTMQSGSQKKTIKDATTNAFIESAELEVSPFYGVRIQGFVGGEYFIFPKFSLGAQYTYGVGFNTGGNQKFTTIEANNQPKVFDFGKTSNYNIGTMGVSSINLTLNF